MLEESQKRKAILRWKGSSRGGGGGGGGGPPPPAAAAGRSEAGLAVLSELLLEDVSCAFPDFLVYCAA